VCAFLYHQLPCGRLVILCEGCALEFYDVLIQKIAKFENTFEEFLLEQQGTPDALDTPKEQHQKGRDRARVHGQQHPGTTGVPQCSDTRADQRDASEAVAKDAILSHGAEAFASTSAPSTSKGIDEFIATRPDTKMGIGGLSVHRGRLDRFVSPVAGLPTNGVSIAANGRMVNERSKMQRPVTSVGESANRKHVDKFAFTKEHRQRTHAHTPQSVGVKVDVPSGLGNGISTANFLCSPFSQQGENASTPSAGGRTRPYSSLLSRGGHGTPGSPIRTGAEGRMDALLSPPEAKVSPSEALRTALLSPEALRTGGNLRRFGSDTSLLTPAQMQARSAQTLFTGVGPTDAISGGRGGWGVTSEPIMEKRLSTTSPLARRGGEERETGARSWGASLNHGTNPVANVVTRGSASSHGQRAKNASCYSGRELDPGAAPGSPVWGLSASDRRGRDSSPWATHRGGLAGSGGVRERSNVMPASGGGIGNSAAFRKIKSTKSEHESLCRANAGVAGFESSPSRTSSKQLLNRSVLTHHPSYHTCN